MRLLFCILALATLSGCWATIEPGTVGVWVESGQVTGAYPAGMYGLDPFFSDVYVVDLRVQRVEVTTSASSSDLQEITATVVLNYTIDGANVVPLFTEVGSLDMVEHTIIAPALQEAVKTATAGYTASELISKRPEVKAEMEAYLSGALAPHYVTVTELSITNFAFSQTFQAAIEQKQVAEQAAQRAENDLVRIRTEAQQAVAVAEGEAAARVAAARAEAEAQALLAAEVTPATLRLRAIEKWDGHLPTTSTGGADVTFLFGSN